VPRLSHRQWENATQQILQLPAPSGLSAAFLDDATTGVFDNNGAELSVGGVLWGDYQRAAEALATQVTDDPAALARIVPDDLPTDSERARAFIRHIGLRAHRRPLTTEQEDAYLVLFTTGPTHEPDLEPFVAGVRVVLMAMLQSPHFLYRVELSDELSGGRIPLDDYEIASRLSFALWNTMPDEELLDAAASGELSEPERLDEQVDRMLLDDRATEMVVRFHDQLLDTRSYADIDRTGFDAWDPELPASMMAEPGHFVRAVFGEGGGLRALLTSPYTYADERLARVYGQTVSGDAFVRIDLDPSQRAGLLTQSGFLARNAVATATDPIHRGVFINHRFICAQLPAPPNDIPPIPPPDGVRRTLRDRIDRHTGPGTCGARCHGTMINPIGFAYEHYDPLGVWRAEDNELPVDASAQYAFEDDPIAYDNAVQLAGVLAQQTVVHNCYSRHWLSYLYGRRTTGADDILVRRIGASSQEEDLDLRSLIAALVTSDAFLARTDIELEDLMEAP